MSERRLARTLLATGAFLLPIVAAVALVVFARGGGGDTAGGTVVVTPNGVVRTYVIPLGAKEKMDKGIFTQDVMPEQVTVNVGDTVVVVNEDVVTHTVGPFTVRAGETQRMVFSEPGYYFGVCTVGDHETVTITAV